MRPAPCPTIHDSVFSYSALKPRTSIRLMDVFKRHEAAVLLVLIILVISDEAEFGERSIRRLHNKHPVFQG